LADAIIHYGALAAATCGGKKWQVRFAEKRSANPPPVTSSTLYFD
jgi:hypothetical protein